MQRVLNSLLMALLIMVIINLLALTLDHFNMRSIVSFEKVIYAFNIKDQLLGFGLAFIAIYIPYSRLMKEETK